MTDREYAVYAGKVGRIVAEIGFSLLFPVYAEFPELEPRSDRRGDDFGSREPVDLAGSGDSSEAAIARTVSYVRDELTRTVDDLQEVSGEDSVFIREGIAHVRELLRELES